MATSNGRLLTDATEPASSPRPSLLGIEGFCRDVCMPGTRFVVGSRGKGKDVVCVHVHVPKQLLCKT